MDPTSREIARLVSTQIGVPNVREAETSCGIMHAVARLEGVSLRRQQLLAAASIGASTRVFDDAYDACPLPLAGSQSEAVSQLALGGNTDALLDTRLVEGMRVARENFGEFALRALDGLIEAQRDSVVQRRPNPSVSVIEEVSRRKGACTVLLYGLEVNPSMSQERRHCYEELGYLLQLVDDFEDCALDRSEGVTTLVTLAATQSAATLLLVQQARKVKQLFAKEYRSEQTVDIFAHVDRLMASVGL